MKLLHLTDTHLGIRRSYEGAHAGWTRAHDHAAAMEHALAPALRGEVDAVIHSGDVFDRSRPPQSAIATADRLLRAVARRVPTFVIPGNHDRNGVCRTLPIGAPGLTVCDRPTRVVIGGVAIGLVPYRRTPSAWVHAAEQAVGIGTDWLVAHQGFDGQAVPGLTFRIGKPADTLGAQHIPRRVSHVLCGHIHPRQAVQLDGCTVVTPGSTERTSWSEANQTKGYAIWDSDKSRPWQFIDLPSRPMVVVRSQADLYRIEPGSLVRCPLAFRQDALARGGLLTWPRVSHQRLAHQSSPQLSLLKAS
ncbi:MAG: DNA repair exonuclease SbcCD nuclease subunit [bacterium]|jgi:DNA repair exonuclease SbcCD nuclease subunit